MLLKDNQFLHIGLMLPDTVILRLAEHTETDSFFFQRGIPHSQIESAKVGMIDIIGDFIETANNAIQFSVTEKPHITDKK